MERLSLRTQARQEGARLAWELRRGMRAFLRRFGSLGWVLMAAAILSLLAARVGHEQGWAKGKAEEQLAQSRAVRQSAPSRTVDTSHPDAREHLKAFDKALLTHADIPTVLQDLINLAEDEQLTFARGEYRPQMDLQGGFLRYRMTLPVKGNAQAVHRFMQAALRAHRTLALESVQFKRELISSTDVEARLQWVVLARSATASDVTFPMTPAVVAQEAKQ